MVGRASAKATEDAASAVGSTGLGLDIVDRIATSIGGQVGFTRSHLGGPSVRVSLPEPNSRGSVVVAAVVAVLATVVAFLATVALLVLIRILVLIVVLALLNIGSGRHCGTWPGRRRSHRLHGGRRGLNLLDHPNGRPRNGGDTHPAAQHAGNTHGSRITLVGAGTRGR